MNSESTRPENGLQTNDRQTKKKKERTRDGRAGKRKRKRENDHAFTPDLLTQNEENYIYEKQCKSFHLPLLTIDSTRKVSTNTFLVGIHVALFESDVAQEQHGVHTFIYYRHCIEKCVSTINKLIIIERKPTENCCENEGLFRAYFIGPSYNCAPNMVHCVFFYLLHLYSVFVSSFALLSSFHWECGEHCNYSVTD